MEYLFTVKSWSHTVIVFFILLTGKSSFAQSIGNDLVFEHITRKQGMADNFVNFIFQDSRGFLWLGSNHGLSRYDGRNFRNYNRLGNDGITDRVVNCITEDSKGNIWFGTESGLNKLDPFTEKITQYHEGNGRGTIPSRWCNYLYTDKDKDIWIGTEKGLALYNEHRDSFQNFPIKVFGKDDRINKFINKIIEDSTGKLWLSTSYGVKEFDKKTKTYISYLPEGKNVSGVFNSLFIDHTGTLWAGSFSDGLYRFNAIADRFEKTMLEGFDQNKFAIYDISEIKIQGNWYLLLATYAGLVSFKPGDKENPDLSYSFSDHNLTKIYTDRQQNLWIGAWQGLFKLNPNSFAFKWVSLGPGNEATPVFHIIPDIQHPGMNFFLTTQTGWYAYNVVTQTISVHTLPADKNKLLPFINNYSSDDRGYWFTSVNGFGYYDLYNNKLFDLSQYTFAASREKTTGYILKVTANTYWITLKRSGILVHNDLTKKDTVLFGDKNKPDNTYGNAIWDMQKGPDGNIWFTSRSKLYIIDPLTLSYKTYGVPPSVENATEAKISPQGILFTEKGKILLSSQLRIYEFKGGQLVTVYPANGLSNLSIGKITEDKENNFWVQTEEGVFKTTADFSRWESMNKLPGMEDAGSILEINMESNGEILFASPGKLGVLKQNLLKKTGQPLPVIISRVHYGEYESYLVSLQKTVIESSYKDAVEIELSLADFINEKENKIQYRLSGWDNEWKELNNGSIVRYEQLPPGDYRFITRSVSQAGLESQETMLNFKVVPPFYRTWWFIITIIILLTAAVFLFYRFRLKKALELERMRTRIATDLHDDIGATLSSISLYSQAVKSQLKGTNPQLENVLDKMGENSRDMVTSMSDIVWAINPDNDDGEKLISRMESYAADMCAVKNIRLHFASGEKLNDVSLPLEHRKNIYLIFKEAMNNAVKYAQAADIWVNIELHNKRLDMLIRDNGSGFNETTIREGNGLKSLRARAAEIKGTLQIDTVKGEGTTVLLQCMV